MVGLEAREEQRQEPSGKIKKEEGTIQLRQGFETTGRQGQRRSRSCRLPQAPDARQSAGANGQAVSPAADRAAWKCLPVSNGWFWAMDSVTGTALDLAAVSITRLYVHTSQ